MIVPPIRRITAAIIIMIMFFFAEKPLGMALSAPAADMYSVSSVFSAPQVGHLVSVSGIFVPQFLHVIVKNSPFIFILLNNSAAFLASLLCLAPKSDCSTIAKVSN